MSVSSECCVLTGRGLCVGLITRPEESYRVRCVSESDREASIIRMPWHTGGCRVRRLKFCSIISLFITHGVVYQLTGTKKRVSQVRSLNLSSTECVMTTTQYRAALCQSVTTSLPGFFVLNDTSGSSCILKTPCTELSLH
jgi:hypothetical protein